MLPLFRRLFKCLQIRFWVKTAPQGAAGGSGPAHAGVGPQSHPLGSYLSIGHLVIGTELPGAGEAL